MSDQPEQFLIHAEGHSPTLARLTKRKLNSGRYCHTAMYNWPYTPPEDERNFNRRYNTLEDAKNAAKTQHLQTRSKRVTHYIISTKTERIAGLWFRDTWFDG